MDQKPLSVGNPLFPRGADPELHRFGETYWIYCTENPSNLNAYYSQDLLTWNKVENILDLSTFPWAERCFWAPGVTEYKGKYYIAFAANAIFQDAAPGTGGMGFGVSESPAGPFVNVRKDRLPMIDHYVHGAQPIDGQFFTDDDGTEYFYFGTGEHCNVSRLNEDFTGFLPIFDGEGDDAFFKEITPASSHERMQFYEGTFVIKRNGIYYLMYSTDGWDFYKYSVVYATSDSPFGPFVEQKKILETDFSVANGPGHHSCLYLPERDLWLICYHRRTPGTAKDTRQPAIDVMTFDEAGAINEVRMTDRWRWEAGLVTVEPGREVEVDLTRKDGATPICSDADPFFPAKRAFDGRLTYDRRWAQRQPADGAYLGVDFGEPTTFDTVELFFEYVDGKAVLQVSDDGVTWQEIASLGHLTGGHEDFVSDWFRVAEEMSEPVTARMLRVWFPEAMPWLSVYQMKVR